MVGERIFSSLASNKSQKSSSTRCTGHWSRAPAPPSLTALLLTNPWDTGQSPLSVPQFPLLQERIHFFCKAIKNQIKTGNTPPPQNCYLTQDSPSSIWTPYLAHKPNSHFFFIFLLETDHTKSQKATIASSEGAVFPKPSRKGQQPIGKHGREVNRAGF